MSTSIQQIIEIRVNGKWTYVPLASTVTDMNNTIGKCGSVRDLFAYRWHNAEDYMNFGVPEDISKEAREAMIFQDEDYINSGACWISWQQYNALSESLRQKMMNDIERIVSAKMDCDISKRLSRIESILAKEQDQILDGAEGEQETEDPDCAEKYIREEMEDHMWAWVSVERNMGEIEAYIDRFLEQESHRDDFPGMDAGARIIMYQS